MVHGSLVLSQPDTVRGRTGCGPLGTPDYAAFLSVFQLGRS
jgi:hypothetical protein